MHEVLGHYLVKSWSVEDNDKIVTVPMVIGALNVVSKNFQKYWCFEIAISTSPLYMSFILLANTL